VIIHVSCAQYQRVRSTRQRDAITKWAATSEAASSWVHRYVPQINAHSDPLCFSRHASTAVREYTADAADAIRAAAPGALRPGVKIGRACACVNVACVRVSVILIAPLLQNVSTLPSSFRMGSPALVPVTSLSSQLANPTPNDRASQSRMAFLRLRISATSYWSQSCAGRSVLGVSSTGCERRDPAGRPWLAWTYSIS